MSVRGEPVRVAPIASADDRAYLAALWVRDFGADFVISRGHRFGAWEVEGFIAWEDDRRTGAATFAVTGPEAELVSINAEASRSGVGTALLAACVSASREAEAARLLVVTTNDNVDALRFYQRRGFRLAALHRGAVDQARLLKPEIPATGDYGIPIHDEIELDRPL